MTVAGRGELESNADGGKDDTVKAKRFTLIELMVVIMIIVVLVGLALPAFMYARKQARVTLAKVQMKQIGIALTNYQATYNNLLPFDSYSQGNTIDLLVNVDVTNGYSTLLTCLNGADSATNPRMLKFLDVQTTSGGTLQYNDPWNQPYRVTLDTTYNEAVQPTHGTAPVVQVIYNSTVAINGSYVIWSAGPDQQDSSTVTAAVNKDNILSWQN